MRKTDHSHGSSNSLAGALWRDVSTLGNGRPLRRVRMFIEAFGANEALPPADDRQRSAPGRYFPGLEAAPWHSPADVPGCDALHRHFPAIRRDLATITRRRAPFTSYKDAEEQATAGKRAVRAGERDDIDVFLTHVPDHDLRERLELVPGVRQAVRGPWFADSAMFSVLTEGNFVGQHSDFMNYVLTVQLGLRVPEGAGIRVGGETSWWTEGECIAFDASFLHEVWNHGPGDRVVLIVSVWHPGLTPLEVRALRRIVPKIRAWERSAPQG